MPRGRKKQTRRTGMRKPEAEKQIVRPLGIAVICVISWIMSFFAVLSGLFVLTAGALISFIPLIGFIGTFASVLGVFLAIVGIVSGVVTYWLWRMEKRGWLLVTVLTGIAFLTHSVSLNAPGAIISLIILAYLWTKRKLF